MKLSLNSRLYVLFTLAIFLVLVVGVRSYTAFQAQTEEGELVKHTYQVIAEADKLQKLLVDMETGRRGYRNTTDTSFLRPYYEALPNVALTSANIRRLVRDSSTQISKAYEMQQHIQNLLNFWESLGQEADSYDQEKRISVTRKEKELMDMVRHSVSDIIVTETALLKKRELKNAATIRTTNWVLIIGTLLILLIVITLIYIIAAEFRRRRRTEIELQKSLEEQEQLNDVNVERNWLLTGMTDVNHGTQGIDDLDALNKFVIDALIKYMELPAGALYYYDEETKLLELKAATGVTYTKKQFSLGEGVPGRAAEGKNILVVKDVPEGYWSIASGTGNTQKGCIICMPLWYNQELKGVLELISFAPMKQAWLDLLNAINNNLAITLNAAEGRARILNLLEQVQVQKEELEHQQEELRQTNEELTRQAEVLQASEEELRVHDEELRQINTELEEKNEAVELAKVALTQKAKELEITSQYKSEFLANMSHELRTPLNSVLILANILAENKGNNLNSKQIEYAQIIHKSGSDLLKLINDILDLSKIEAGKVELSFEAVSVKNITEDIQQLFHVVAEEKEVEFTVTTQPEVPATITTDIQRLEQVIKNLLSNAFKFTPKAGRVSLQFYYASSVSTIKGQPLADGEAVIGIAVTDTGIGISPVKQQLIFEAFQQADGSTSRKYGGTGLGLSISKELVRILGGELQVTSKEGEGSTFTILLPVNASAIQQHIATTRPLPEEMDGDVADITPLQVTEQTKVLDDRNKLAKGDKIMLIIEDDAQFARIVQDFARNKNYKTIVALQGDEGLYYARKYRPNAIILDMQLPVIDGWNLLKIFREDEMVKNIPVHIISAADEARLASNGAVAYLSKPVSKDDLEKAFSVLGEQVSAGIKKLLVVSGEYLKSNDLHGILQERHLDVNCTYAGNINEAITLIKETRFDCIIADIGKDIEKGIEEVQRLRNSIQGIEIPVIIYLDNDISASDELQLKRISNVIIRDSSFARDRLIDEMELFLYKLQEGAKKITPPQNITLVDNDILIGKKVLLVDDDMRNVFALSTALETQKMEVITASDGKDALDQLKNNPGIQVVLMDIMMPEMDGFEAIRQIRGQLKLTRLPVIALTAKAMQGDKEKCLEAGASDYITKPIDINRLFSLMRVWLSQ
ncbi:Signal transduction histidine kinase [Filimonas lacunae]|uniref:histidine kinase n=1 Tax=Filimonas lacunae TaxID=477680 RepID=A0A173MK76_9BACT|nr:response regulator [Filimonas lacunae]BAV08043.1 sensor histidine kinase [Filimonas lacunae]SIT08499.1 Signal transduction histidine kinase [Filimonas lacunae]